MVGGFVSGVDGRWLREEHGQAICRRRTSRITVAMRRNSNEDDENLKFDVARRVLTFCGLTGIAYVAAKIWGFYGFEIIDNFSNRQDAARRPPKILRPLDQKLTDGILQIMERVAVSEMRLISKSQLLDDKNVLEAKALKFFDTDAMDITSATVQFNLDLYSLLHVIAEKTVSKSKRLDFMQSVGNNLYRRLRSSSDKMASYEKRSRESPQDPQPVIEGMQTILDLFVAAGFTSGYKIDLPPLQETFWREDGKCSFTIFIDDLASMISAQLLAGEEYDDTAPLIIPSVIVAFLTSCRINVSSEDFYIDNTYQSNPANYRPEGTASLFEIQTAS